MISACGWTDSGRLRISNLQEEIRNSKSGVVDELCGNGGGFLVQGSLLEIRN